jgi:methylthioribose-1-phosphate isomerase
LRWLGDAKGHLDILDQTRLPEETVYIACRDVESVYQAIRCLSVRGAPAIGIAAAYGVVLAAQQEIDSIHRAIDHLASSRPTAVNLFWALNRMRAVIERERTATNRQNDLVEILLREARAIHDEDREMCQRIGLHGLPLLRDARNVLTHCNAGALATGGIGTALAPIYVAHQQGRSIHVYADETRPLLQGARLTAWELTQAGIPVTVLCDNMAGTLLGAGKVDAVIVGADRIAANGDTANKIGTYPLAVLAKHHQIPFYVAAPSSTFDQTLSHGELIPIEHRAADEVCSLGHRRVVPQGARTFNPAFDVTPAELITAFITDQGIRITDQGTRTVT